MGRQRYMPQQLGPGGTDPVSPFPARRAERGEYRRFTIGTPIDGAHEAPLDPVAQHMEELRAQAQAEGYTAGKAAAEEEMAGLLENWRASVAEAAALRASLAEVGRREMIELALSVAAAVLQREVTEHTAAIEQAIQAALDQLDAREHVRVTLGNADKDRLTPWLDELRQQGLDISVAADPSLGPGDMRVSSAAGSVEHLLAERLERVRGLVLGNENETLET